MAEGGEELRVFIIDYLKMKKYLNIAAARVVNENKIDMIDNIAENYKVSNIYLRLKVRILNNLYDYDEERNAYETAVGSILYHRKPVEMAAAEYKLDPTALKNEYDRYIALKHANMINEPYIYDKYLDGQRVFLFREELSLMFELRQWKYKSPPSCTCLICAIEQLSSLAYHFAKEKNKVCPSSWDLNHKVDKIWLLKFIMTHDERLSNLYPNYNDNVQELMEICKNA